MKLTSLSRSETSLGIRIILLGFIPSRSYPIHLGFLRAADSRLGPAPHVKVSIPTVPGRNVPYLFLERARKKKALRFYVSLGPVLNLPKYFGPVPSGFGELDGNIRLPERLLTTLLQ